MNCQACGHSSIEHERVWLKGGLCQACLEDYGGPCYPWEFR